jgi:hypothetical protein
MNEEITSINLYDIGGPDSPNVKNPDKQDREEVVQDVHSAAFLTDNEDLDTDEMENDDDAF